MPVPLSRIRAINFCIDLRMAVGEHSPPLAAVERQLILARLEHRGHQKERTAAARRVSLKTLYNRLQEYGAS